MCPSCTDGTDTAWEQCDDGDGTDSNGCANACRGNLCGDGIPYLDASDEDHPRFPLGLEACDDCNAIDGDACPNDCGVMYGDGVVGGCTLP